MTNGRRTNTFTLPVRPCSAGPSGHPLAAGDLARKDTGGKTAGATWLATVLCLIAPALFAGQTRTWSQGDFADFEKGIIKNLSLRSDGLLTLAPLSRELFDTSSAYLWALAQDSKGNFYAGGGTGAKLS